jgi:hypothetical protein
MNTRRAPRPDGPRGYRSWVRGPPDRLSARSPLLDARERPGLSSREFRASEAT